MENVSYIGLSRQMSLSRQMEITANNIANMSTPGFKAESVLLKEYVNKTPAITQSISQVQDYGTFRDFRQGATQQTGNPLDAAISGEGYFAVQTPQGTRYTRDGSFSLNATGELVTRAGYKVTGDGGPIVIPAESSHITINANGTVSTEDGVVGKIKLVKFANEQALAPTGENLYDAKGAAEQKIETPNIMQGMIEGSNVQPIVEMSRMIQISRLYQSTQQMLQQDHQQKRTMIQKLTQV